MAIGGIKTPWKLARHGTKPGGPLRSPKHLAWIRTQPCLCARKGGCIAQVQAAHVRQGADGGLASKPSDSHTIPLCFGHHRESHAIGDDTFQRKYALDLGAAALGYALRSPDSEVRERAKRDMGFKAGEVA